MIYLDTSVALAQLLAEDRAPPQRLWTEPLVTSRLLLYEMWNRLHSLGLAKSHGDDVRELIARVAIVELTSTVLARALEPFPIAVRTLDALHLASAEFLRERSQDLVLATYDARMAEAARHLGLPLYDL